MVLKLETTVEKYSNETRASFIGSKNLPIVKKFVREDEALRTIIRKIEKITNEAFEPEMVTLFNNGNSEETLIYNHIGQKENQVIKIRATLDGRRVELLEFVLNKAS